MHYFYRKSQILDNLFGGRNTNSFNLNILLVLFLLFQYNHDVFHFFNKK